MGFECGVFLLLTLPALAQTRVVTDFSNYCPQFFFPISQNSRGYPMMGGFVNPNQNRYKYICQQRVQQPRYEFATLYDTQNKIPLYSAYTVTGIRQPRNTNNWLIEPDLESLGNHLQGPAGNHRTTNQAVNTDYNNSLYDKGHLFPVYHTSDPITAEATFTLTNAVPQDSGLNRGKWSAMEKEVGLYIYGNCLCTPQPAYVVAGAVPGISQINNRVNVPALLWTAFCCFDKTRKRWESRAHYAFNGQNQPVIELSLANLETQLSGGYGQSFSVFGGQCQNDIPVGITIYPHGGNQGAG